ncbi:hypothetical protein N7G274_008106 [Stereocaulon virgatum]|uniref:Uncharacterized protein n=1 Tax=Stereocaulon virgatum TaxID=373712 RepID=A0ABR3ZZE0_9LECA
MSIEGSVARTGKVYSEVSSTRRLSKLCIPWTLMGSDQSTQTHSRLYELPFKQSVLDQELVTVRAESQVEASKNINVSSGTATESDRAYKFSSPLRDLDLRSIEAWDDYTFERFGCGAFLRTTWLIFLSITRMEWRKG